MPLKKPTNKERKKHHSEELGHGVETECFQASHENDLNKYYIYAASYLRI